MAVPIPSEGRLINTAQVIEPNDSAAATVYLIGWLGQPFATRAPLVAVNLGKLKTSLTGAAVTALTEAVGMAEDLAPALQTAEPEAQATAAVATPVAAKVQARAAAVATQASEPEEVRVSIEELIDTLHGYKQADFTYELHETDKGIEAALIDDTQHLLLPADADPIVLTARTKTQGRKAFATFDTGIPVAAVAAGTLAVSVEAKVPSAVSYYVNKGHVWLAAWDTTAKYHVHVLVPMASVGGKFGAK